MRKGIAIILIIIALAVGGVVGWLIKGSQAGAPAKEPTTTTTQPSTGSQQSSNTGTTASNGQCTAKALSASVAAAPGGAAAGNRYYNLTLTNTSSDSCTLNGYPGVSLTDSTGAQVGSPADKDTANGSSTVSLATGKSAVATLHLSVSDNYPSGTCTSGATMVKVYPPNDTNFLTTSTTDAAITTWCPGFTTTAFTAS